MVGYCESLGVVVDARQSESDTVRPSIRYGWCDKPDGFAVELGAVKVKAVRFRFHAVLQWVVDIRVVTRGVRTRVLSAGGARARISYVLPTVVALGSGVGFSISIPLEFQLCILVCGLTVVVDILSVLKREAFSSTSMICKITYENAK